LTAQEAEKLLSDAGVMIRSKGSHRIYCKENIRVVVPFQTSRILHPKIVIQVFKVIEDAE
jgi:predicted RNA binding protein YcfA (HicA-like mRNA interferase family)